MTKSKKQQKKKTTGKSSKNSNSGSTAGAIAMTVAKTLGPILLKGLGAAAGIPFPTSGARAIASPSPGSVMQLSAPAANGAMVKTSKARTANTRNGIRVTHREYISDVVHSTADEFELLEFESINPVNATLFPWLSTIATRFETYRFEKLRFIYEPQTATTSLGTIMMVVDYDANDSPPSDKTQMMSYKGAVRSPAWFACCNDSDRSDLQKQKNYYTMNSSAPGTTSDGRLNDVGKFILAFQSESAPYSAGELYVEYDIHLDTPQLQENTFSKSLAINNFSVTGTETISPIFAADAFDKGDLPVEGINDSGNTYLDFGAAGFYQVVLSTQKATDVVGTGEFLWDLSTPAGSQAVVRLHANAVGYQETMELQQFVMGSWFVYVPNPNELVEIVFDATSATTQPFLTAFATITPFNRDSIPGYIVFPDEASASLKLRSLRLMEKRRAAMPTPLAGPDKGKLENKVRSAVDLRKTQKQILRH